ncbi:hypothetical protein IV40_GL001909 [Lactobacillus selangorensis]|nr:hypothetical protein IV40_GL001909 [Lactobacillus selangorensis]
MRHKAFILMESIVGLLLVLLGLLTFSTILQQSSQQLQKRQREVQILRTAARDSRWKTAPQTGPYRLKRAKGEWQVVDQNNEIQFKVVW